MTFLAIGGDQRPPLGIFRCELERKCVGPSEFMMAYVERCL